MFVYFINVPLNEVGMLEFEEYAKEMPNVKTFTLTQDEYETLRQPKGLFQEFDDKFGIFIDVCEEERINEDALKEALQIAKKHLLKRNSEIAKNGILKVIESLECAIACKTFWEIDIYLE